MSEKHNPDIRELSQKASDGPWEMAIICGRGFFEAGLASEAGLVCQVRSVKDGQFIAAARNELPALLDERDGLLISQKADKSLIHDLRLNNEKQADKIESLEDEIDRLTAEAAAITEERKKQQLTDLWLLSKKAGALPTHIENHGEIYIYSENGFFARARHEDAAKYIVAACAAVPGLLNECAEKNAEIKRQDAAIVDLQEERAADKDYIEFLIEVMSTNDCPLPDYIPKRRGVPAAPDASGEEGQGST